MRIVRKMLFFVFSMAVGLAQADTATIGANQDNTVTFGAAGGTLATNVQGSGGTASTLLVRAQNSPPNASKVWIRFDLSNLEYNAGASATVTVTAAASANFSAETIRLYVLNTNFTAGAGVLGTGWTEGTITWSNAPGNKLSNDIPGGKECDLTQTVLMGAIAAPATPAAGDVYAFAITNSLGKYIQADKSVTVMLTMTPANNGSTFASKENATAAWRPKLTYTLSPAQGTLIQFK